jgi:AIPR protein
MAQAKSDTRKASSKPNTGPVEVEVVFKGVETPKRLQNAEDVKRGIVRHTFDVPASMLAPEVLLDLDGPNPRTPNTRKTAARRLRESLEGADPATVGSFHLAHGGIRGLVKSFDRIDDNTYKATFEVETGTRAQDDGIANGLHTIAVIQKALQEGQIPRGQYVTITLIENVDASLVPYIGEGQNTNIQVAEESIIDLGGAFEPFKEAMASKDYSKEVGWHENEGGQYDARDVFSILNALNVIRFPNDDKDRHPIESYEKQGRTIQAFGNELDDKSKPPSFNRMIPIMNDALYLYDWIGKDAWDRYKHAVPDGSPGSLAIMEKRVDRENNAIPDVWTFPFISEGKPEVVKSTYRLAKGVRFAMLAAFRAFVRVNEETGLMEWVGGFEQVLAAWQAIGGEMMVTAKDVSKAAGYNPTAVGKNRPFWRQLHQIAATYLMQQEYERMRLELDQLKLSTQS